MDGVIATLTAAWKHLVRREGAQPDTELFQTSIMGALLQGQYEGSMSYATLALHGDFGIGTFNDLDGEMIAFDGRFYQLRSDGSVRTVEPKQLTPFALVTFFKPAEVINIDSESDQAAVATRIEQSSSANLFTAIKLEGHFRKMTTRTVEVQSKPFPPLIEAAAHEKTLSFSQIEGTIIGFRTPAYAQGIGVPGLHLHFLSRDERSGGHVLSYSLDSGNLQLMPLHTFHLELPIAAEFVGSTLSLDSFSKDVKEVEGG